MFLFALSIAPGIAISLYFFFRDQYNREPRRRIITSFFLGMLSALIALVIEVTLLSGLEGLVPTVAVVAVKAFLIVALAEEWSKYIMVRNYAMRKPEFDEPFDGIVYAVMVSMGFATLENIAYVFEHGLATAVMRMFLSVPAHASFAVLMGYYMGKAKFDPFHRRRLMIKGLLLATFFHGCFDFFLFLQENSMVKKYVSDLLLFGGAVFSYAVAIYLSRKAVRIHIATSREMHETLQA
jgi:RsiW-degrading membrane proteinase PrsW (M82 family)